MEIYEALKKDHDALKAKLRELCALDDKSVHRAAELVTEIRDEMIPHSRAEEAVFYNSLRMIDTSDKIALHGYREHLEGEALLRALQVELQTGIAWKATAEKLRDALTHHIQEEETEMFEAGQALFTSEEAESMCEVFENLKPRIKEEGFFQNTLDMIRNMMSTRFSGLAKKPTMDKDINQVR